MRLQVRGRRLRAYATAPTHVCEPPPMQRGFDGGGRRRLTRPPPHEDPQALVLLVLCLRALCRETPWPHTLPRPKTAGPDSSGHVRVGRRARETTRTTGANCAGETLRPPRAHRRDAMRELSRTALHQCDRWPTLGSINLDRGILPSPNQAERPPPTRTLQRSRRAMQHRGHRKHCCWHVRRAGICALVQHPISDQRFVSLTSRCAKPGAGMSEQIARKHGS